MIVVDDKNIAKSNNILTLTNTNTFENISTGVQTNQMEIKSSI